MSARRCDPSVAQRTNCGCGENRCSALPCLDETGEAQSPLRDLVGARGAHRRPPPDPLRHDLPHRPKADWPRQRRAGRRMWARRWPPRWLRERRAPALGSRRFQMRPVPCASAASAPSSRHSLRSVGLGRRAMTLCVVLKRCTACRTAGAGGSGTAIAADDPPEHNTADVFVIDEPAADGDWHRPSNRLQTCGVSGERQVALAARH